MISVEALLYFEDLHNFNDFFPMEGMKSEGNGD